MDMRKIIDKLFELNTITELNDINMTYYDFRKTYQILCKLFFSPCAIVYTVNKPAIIWLSKQGLTIEHVFLFIYRVRV